MSEHHDQHHHEPQPIVHDSTDRLAGTPLRKFFEATVTHLASDLLIKPDAPPKLRLSGTLKDLEAKPFTVDEFEQVIEKFLLPEQLEHYHHHGSFDLAYDFDEDNRFRVNIFRTRGVSAIAARRISSEILNYEQLNLPPIMGEMTKSHQGLVLLCGVTGSGKSTTIAAMLQEINERRRCHILTVEDPIEYIFKSCKATVNQREIGVDVPDFPTALRALVRENPDVVLIGELRDRETFEAAIQAAETGHLVFGTIHASSASQAFSRIYNLFPPEERDLIRDMFAYTLKAIVYQKLLKSLTPKYPRVPAVEILLNNPVVQKYIFDGRESELGDVIRRSQQEGMKDFTTSLVELVQKEYIHPKVALENANNPDELKMRMKGISTT